MTRAEEIEELKRKLAARKNRGGYAQNVRDIEARIAELEAQMSQIDWSLLGPPVDIGGHFNQGMKIGQAMVAKRRQENALATLMAHPDDETALNALAVADPDMAFKFARTRGETLKTRREDEALRVSQTIGQQYASGDKTGAVNAAVGAGQFDLAATLQKLDPQDGKKVGDYYKAAAPMAYQMKQMKDPAARQAFWQRAKPILLQQGGDPAALDAFDPNDDVGLDAIITQGQTVNDLINSGKVTWHQQGEQPSFATDAMGRPVGNQNPYRGAQPAPTRDPLAPTPAAPPSGGGGGFFTALTTVPGGEPGATREGGRIHKGRDYSGLSVGTPVPAPQSARLIDSGVDGQSGNWGKWQLADGSYMSVAHLASPPSAKMVEAGQPLGMAGNTGNASTRGTDRAVLHVRTWTPDRQEMDPARVFGGGSGKPALPGGKMTAEQLAQRAIARGADPAKVRARLAQLQGGR